MRLSGSHVAAGLVRRGCSCLLAVLAVFLLAHAAGSQAASPQFTIDSALVFLDQSSDPNAKSGNVDYSFRGHEFGNPGNRSWWSVGAGGAPDTGTPTKALASSDGGLFGASAPDVALTRGGVGMAVWEEDTNGTPTCLFGNVPQETPHVGHIKFATLDGRTLPGKAPTWSAPADLATGSDYHMYLDPSIALDVNGRGIAVWREVEFQHDVSGCVTPGTKTRTRYRIWNGQAWQGPASGTVVPGSELDQNITESTIRSFATRVRFLSTSAAPGAATRQRAVVVWNDFLRQETVSCSGTMTSFNEFWPQYSVWDGNSFGSADAVPGDPPGSPYFQTTVQRKDRIGLAADRSNGADLVFQTERTDDICALGTTPTPEIQAAHFDSTTSDWTDPVKIADGHGPDVAEQPHGSGVAVYGASVEARYESSPGSWGGPTTIDGVDTGKAAVAALPLDQTLAAWTQKDSTHDNGALRWSEQPGLGAWSAPAQLAATARNPSLSALPVSRWDFLYYGAGDNNLAGCVAKDVEHMEATGSDANASMVVQVDDNASRPLCQADGDGSYRSQVVYDPAAGRASSKAPFRVDLTAPDMGSAQTLGDYLSWASEMYPADRYALSISDHGDGWRYVATDSTSGSALSMGALSAGLSRGPPLDALVFDACLMAQIEVGYQVFSSANRMVASQDCVGSTSGAFPYGTVLSDLQANSGMSGDAVATDMVSRWSASQAANTDFTVSAFRLNLDFLDLVQAVDRLGGDLRHAADDVNQRLNPADNAAAGIKAARGSTRETSTCCTAGGAPTHLFVDLADLTRQLDAQPTVGAAYKTEDAIVRDKLARACIAEHHGTDYGADPSAGCLDGRAGGLSIYFPPRQSGPPAAGTDETFDQGSSYGTIYAANPAGPANVPAPATAGFIFPALSGNGWDEFLYRYYRPVADAGPGLIGEVGDMLTLSAAGSSVTDPNGLGGLTYAWDFNPGVNPDPSDSDSGGVDVPKHVNATTQQPKFPCASVGTFPVRLVVHDDHEMLPGLATYFRTDDSWTTVTCVAPGSPSGAFAASLKFSKTKLVTALRHGLPIVVTCSEPCSIDAQALLASGSARGFGLARAKKPVRVARGTARLPKAGRKRVVLTFTRKAKKRLARATRLTLTLRVSVKGSSRTGRVIAKKIVLRR